MKKTVVIRAGIVIVVLSTIGCVHAIKDETNFTSPGLRTYRTIVVLPFAPVGSLIDTYFAEALDEYWSGVMVIPPETLLAKFNHEDRKSFREAGYSIKDIGEPFGADAVTWAAISTHMFSPNNQIYDSRTRRIYHLTTYLVDLKTHDTLACYHSEGSMLAYASKANYYAEEKRRIVATNVSGLLKLARASGHL